MLPDRKEVRGNKYEPVTCASLTVFINYGSFPSCDPFGCRSCERFLVRFLFWFLGHLGS